MNTKTEYLKIEETRIRFCRNVIRFLAESRGTNLLPLIDLSRPTGISVPHLKLMFPDDCYGDSLKVTPENSTP